MRLSFQLYLSNYPPCATVARSRFCPLLCSRRPPLQSKMPSFGTIKIVQQRCPGAPIKLCKAALVDNDDDIDAAAAHIDATTEFKDINPPARTSSDGVGGGNTTYADHLAGRPCLVDCTEQNAPVVIIRIEVGDGPPWTLDLDLTLSLSLAPTMSLSLALTLTRIKVGDDKTYPAYGDTLRVHYTGKLQECGTVFDSSRTPGRTPFDFKIGKKEVIPGWDEAVMKMSLGEVSLLMVPSSKAYGEALS